MKSDYYLDKAMCTCIGYISEDDKFICAHLDDDLTCQFFTDPICEYVHFYDKAVINVDKLRRKKP